MSTKRLRVRAQRETHLHTSKNLHADMCNNPIPMTSCNTSQGLKNPADAPFDGRYVVTNGCTHLNFLQLGPWWGAPSLRGSRHCHQRSSRGSVSKLPLPCMLTTVAHSIIDMPTSLSITGRRKHALRLQHWMGSPGQSRAAFRLMQTRLKTR